MQIDRRKQHELRRLQSEGYYATAIPHAHASTPHKSDFLFPLKNISSIQTSTRQYLIPNILIVGTLRLVRYFDVN